MSGSTETYTVHADPDVETLVIDHAFRLVHRAAGSFMHVLPSGLYKFQFRRGTAVSEQFVELPAAGTITPNEELRSASAAPLADTAGPQQHRAAAKGMSAAAVLGGEHGSRIFIFARATADAPANVAAGLTLHTIDGKLLHDLSKDAARGSGYAGRQISVSPGAYRLRHSSREEVLEMCVVASKGWQTHVFLLHGTESPLATASVMMSRRAFDPEDESLRLVDAALTALRQKRVYMARELVLHLIQKKIENPMLGIYAAHAMRASGDPEFEHVLAMLQNLVPGHPDVEALRLDGSARKFEAPPMLRSSWNAIREASLTGGALLGSLPSRIPPAILEGTPWLIWSPDELLDPALTKPRDVTGELQEIAAAIDREDVRDLTEEEEQLFAFMARRARIAQHAKKTPSESLDAVTLARAFGATLPHVQATIASLAQKLR